MGLLRSVVFVCCLYVFVVVVVVPLEEPFEIQKSRSFTVFSLSSARNNK
jgi:hypothetical protein